MYGNDHTVFGHVVLLKKCYKVFTCMFTVHMPTSLNRPFIE